MEEKLLTAYDLQRLGFTRSRAYSILQSEDIRTIRIGHRLFLSRDELNRWLDAHVQQGRASCEIKETPTQG